MAEETKAPTESQTSETDAPEAPEAAPDDYQGDGAAPQAEATPWTQQDINVPAGPLEETTSFETYPADAYTHDDLGLSGDEVVEMYRNMMLQRRFEQRCRQMYQRQKISGFLHLYIGQEAVSTGLVNAIRVGEDSVITAYRDHGLGLALGMDPNACMAELFGKRDGCSKGKGGSMHFFSKEHAFYGGHGIVGAHIPLGAGLAFAHQYRGEDNVAVCLFGDGAINQGPFHEAINLSGLYDLPLVLVCENNQYGMGTAVERAAAEPNLYRQATGYAMPGLLCYGMDVFSTTKAWRDAVAMGREGQPTFMEIRTYRYQGHSISDPAKYRKEGELDDRKSMDPIVRLQRYMVEHDIATDDELNDIDDALKQQVLDAIDFADNSPLPDESAIYDDVYADRDSAVFLN